MCGDYYKGLKGLPISPPHSIPCLSWASLQQRPGSLLQKYPYCVSTMHINMHRQINRNRHQLYREIHVYKVYYDWIPMALSDYISHILSPRISMLPTFFSSWRVPITSCNQLQSIILTGTVEALSIISPTICHYHGGYFYGIDKILWN